MEGQRQKKVLGDGLVRSTCLFACQCENGSLEGFWLEVSYRQRSTSSTICSCLPFSIWFFSAYILLFSFHPFLPLSASLSFQKGQFPERKTRTDILKQLQEIPKPCIYSNVIGSPSARLTKSASKQEIGDIKAPKTKNSKERKKLLLSGQRKVLPPPFLVSCSTFCFSSF